MTQLSPARSRDVSGVSARRTVASALAVTTVGVLPVYLVGGLAVQVRADLSFDRAALGAVVAVYFAVSAIGSLLLGRVVEGLGARRSMRRGACLSVVSLLGVALLAQNVWHVAAFLAVGGLANAAAQPAANLALARGVKIGRQGLVFGIKQAAIPIATLLAGLAVPAFALAFGWRWAFLAGAVVAALAAVTVPRRSSDASVALTGESMTGASAVPAGQRERARSLEAGLRPLLVFAAAGCLGSAVANSLGVFTVEAAVSQGWQPVSAGRLLVVGSVMSVIARIAVGWSTDRRRVNGAPGVAVLMAIGAVGVLLMSASGDRLAVFAVGTMLAFAAGWGWPGLYYFSVVQANRGTPAAATGLVQSGVYLGGMGGPLAFGFLAQYLSYETAWLSAGASLLLAAGAILLGWRMLPSPNAT